MKIPHPILTVSGLKIEIGGQCVLDDVTLSLPPATSVLIQGPNGAGKSSLINALLGFLKPTGGQVIWDLPSGRTKHVFPARLWRPNRDYTPEDFARRGAIRGWQDIRLFPRLTVVENISVATPKHPGERLLLALLSPWKVLQFEKVIQDRVRKILSLMELSSHALSFGSDLSLGQSKRIAHARILQTNPSVLFLDEPLAGLDANGQAILLDDLLRWKKKGGSLVVVEHAMNVEKMRPLVEQIWTVESAKVVVSPRAKVSSAQTCQPKLNKKQYDIIEALSSGLNSKTELSPEGGAVTRIYPEWANSRDPILEISGLRVRRGFRTLPNSNKEVGWTFSLKPGEIVVWKAPNGSGKTSCFDAIMGLCAIEHGNISFNGNELNGLQPYERVRLGMRYLTSRDNIMSDLLVNEVLAIWQVRNPPSEVISLYRRRIATLSGGERQRIALCCVLYGPPGTVYFLDEPFNALDMVYRKWAIDRLKQLKNSAIVITEPAKS